MMYAPDGWVIVKITGQEPHYRVFASWRGNFVQGDSWQLNSGVVKCRLEGQDYIFTGFSGSTYICHRKTYNNLSLHNSSVLANMIEKSDGKMEICEDQEDWTKQNWTIK